MTLSWTSIWRLHWNGGMVVGNLEVSHWKMSEDARKSIPDLKSVLP